MRNNSRIALNRSTWWVELRDDIYTIFQKKLNAEFTHLLVLLKYGKTLFEAEERSDWISGFVRFQQLNSPVIPRQLASMQEEAWAEHWWNIRLEYTGVFKCGNARTVQNHLVYHLRDEKNQQKWRFLWEKLQDVRDKNKQNTTLLMRSVAAKIVCAQLKGCLMFIGLSQFAVHWCILKLMFLWIIHSHFM